MRTVERKSRRGNKGKVWMRGRIKTMRRERRLILEAMRGLLNY